MPRITKKQKESGKVQKPRDSKPKSATRPTGRPSATGGKVRSSNHAAAGGGGGYKGNKGGFQVGPTHAPKNAYLGKGTYLFVPIREVVGADTPSEED